MEVRAGDRVIAISSSDRVVFPESGITKGDVVRYYRDVADLLVRELRDRPLTLERFNKGIGGEGYFQKHAPKYFPAWIERTEVAGRKPVIHAVCNTAADLVYMANQNALTFHIPTARIDQPAAPDRIIIDLDPPPGRFDLVVWAARRVGELLDELALPRFLKTTGSKGLHVVVPLDRSASYGAVYRFASRLARLLCARHPDRLTTEFYKKDRAGRLFVDIDRNHFGATAVAAYSVRAREGAPVAFPITWDELDDPELRSDGVGIRELPSRLAAVGDLWGDLETYSVALAPVASRLEQISRA